MPLHDVLESTKDEGTTWRMFRPIVLIGAIAATCKLAAFLTLNDFDTTYLLPEILLEITTLIPL